MLRTIISFLHEVNHRTNLSHLIGNLEDTVGFYLSGVVEELEHLFYEKVLANQVFPDENKKMLIKLVCDPETLKPMDMYYFIDTRTGWQKMANFLPLRKKYAGK